MEENKTLTETENLNDKKKTFSLNIPLDKYVIITTLFSKKTAEGLYNYSLKDAFTEGLELLKTTNPKVSNKHICF